MTEQICDVDFVRSFLYIVARKRGTLVPAYRISKTNRPVACNLYTSKPTFISSWAKQRYVDDFDYVFYSCESIPIGNIGEALILFKLDEPKNVNGIVVSYFGIQKQFLEQVND